MNDTIRLEAQYCAHNYHPLPVVLTRGEGVFVWDDDGKRYLDMMSAYSAVSHGHAHPRLVKLVQQQVATLNIVSRAFHTDRLGPFLARACELTDYQQAHILSTLAAAYAESGDFEKAVEHFDQAADLANPQCDFYKNEKLPPVADAGLGYTAWLEEGGGNRPEAAFV